MGAFVLVNNILNFFITRDHPSMIWRIEENVSMRISITLVGRELRCKGEDVFRERRRLQPESVSSVVVAGQGGKERNIKKL